MGQTIQPLQQIVQMMPLRLHYQLCYLQQLFSNKILPTLSSLPKISNFKNYQILNRDQNRLLTIAKMENGGRQTVFGNRLSTMNGRSGSKDFNVTKKDSKAP